MRYIGDVHGKIKEYLSIIDKCEESIQVGDMCAGFVKLAEPKSSHRFIRGNHDAKIICQTHPNWIKDNTFDSKTSTYFCGGAWSIDQNSRIEGVSWWRDEQLSYSEFSEAIDYYEVCKPRIVVTHDCPQNVAQILFPNARDITTTTGQALESMLDIHKPEIWIFGHWHEHKDQIIDGVRFICLEELGYIDL